MLLITISSQSIVFLRISFIHTLYKYLWQLSRIKSTCLTHLRVLVSRTNLVYCVHNITTVEQYLLSKSLKYNIQRNHTRKCQILKQEVESTLQRVTSWTYFVNAWQVACVFFHGLEAIYFSSRRRRVFH